MALSVKAKKLTAKYRKDEDDDNAYVNTEFTIKDTSCDENDQPYYDQLDNTDPDINHQKAKPNEYSQWEDRQISTDEIYENNEQSVNGVLQQKEVISLESKLPITNSSKGLNIRHYTIGIGILAVICVILVVALIAVAVTLSARSKCEGLGCLNNGICTVVSGYMKCECLEGFDGSRCEVTPCDTKICEYGGDCFLKGIKPECSCRTGFEGENCTITPCSSNPCLHTGVCTFGLNTSDYVCSCQPGFTGVSCEVTPCNSTPCKNNGNCSVVSNGFSCLCVEGTGGPQCEDYKCDVESTNENSYFLEQDLFDNYDWIRTTNSTPTSATGPQNAAEGNYYFYYEGNSGSDGSRARLVSRRMNTGYAKCLSFNYHMFGSTMGSLYVIRDKSIIWGESRNQNIWHFVQINISSTVSRISFEARRGTNIFSDMAIDNITISHGVC